jgi:predicted Rossmann fold nucleotide-binding protein DprA/Smf involved in DNA uptake
VDGATPVRDVQDVIAAVELAVAGRSAVVPPRAVARVTTAPERSAEAPNPIAARILDALDHDPASLDTVVRRCALPLTDVALALEQLAAGGLAAGAGGWWSRPVG